MNDKLLFNFILAGLNERNYFMYGRGSRMGELTSMQPKCQTELHGKSLIEWQMQSLNRASLMILL